MVGSPRKRSHAEATANASSSGTNAVENGKEAKRVEESTLDKLKKHSIVVADTGDFNQLKTFAPQDATTNPTLIYQAIQMPAYAHLLDEAIEEAKKQVAAGGGGGKKKEKDKEKNEEDALVDEICDRLSVKFGIEILKIVPGVVSTEVNASLSFDTQGSIEKARKLIGLYESAGVDRKKVLIKMATTWEGCKAATVLEKEKIHVNMTLLFSLTQAICAAEANATLISPFVGRILDWHVKKFKEEQKKDDKNKSDKGPDYLTDSSKDPGVLSVQKIYKYYKKFGYKTIIMGASFRNTGEIINLSGCDKLTIAPKLLDELNKSSNDAPAILSEKMEFPEDMQKIHLDEKNFRWQLNEDQMATEKLSEGIRNFNADLVRLKNLVKEKLKEKKK